eukprot:c987_g1_i1.p1 GENE.c987_g1_i1~~c987_g1_i1.p1  ORF type:complete len:222 (+),score=32.01 c987_g1_i1:81-668(+)
MATTVSAPLVMMSQWAEKNHLLEGLKANLEGPKGDLRMMLQWAEDKKQQIMERKRQNELRRQASLLRMDPLPDLDLENPPPKPVMVIPAPPLIPEMCDTFDLEVVTQMITKIFDEIKDQCGSDRICTELVQRATSCLVEHQKLFKYVVIALLVPCKAQVHMRSGCLWDTQVDASATIELYHNGCWVAVTAFAIGL